MLIHCSWGQNILVLSVRDLAIGMSTRTAFQGFRKVSIRREVCVRLSVLLQIFHASPKLAAVGSVDEAVVIGAALALSSSAFVLQLMSERGELATKFGSATLGILLLQVTFLI